MFLNFISASQKISERVKKHDYILQTVLDAILTSWYKGMPLIKYLFCHVALKAKGHSFFISLKLRIGWSNCKVSYFCVVCENIADTS